MNRGIRNVGLIATTLMVLVGVLGFGPRDWIWSTHNANAATTAPVVSVSGNQITFNGVPHTTHEVNLLADGACWGGAVKANGYPGYAIFDRTPTDAVAQAMIADGVDTVRITTDETCINGNPGLDPAFSGTNYVNAIVNAVDVFGRNGMAAIVDLHKTAPGTAIAKTQLAMPDADNSPRAWQALATALKTRTNWIADLFNEPYPSTWSIWKNGGSVTSGGYTYTAVGMKSLHDTVRAIDSTVPLALGGIAYANDLSAWLAWRPNDAYEIAEAHVYYGNACATTTCYNNKYLPIINSATDPHPVLIGESGPGYASSDAGNGQCNANGTGTLIGSDWSVRGNGPLTWAAAQPAGTAGMGAFGWVKAPASSPQGCGGGPALVLATDTGAGTEYGNAVFTFYHAHP